MLRFADGGIPRMTDIGLVECLDVHEVVAHARGFRPRGNYAVGYLADERHRAVGICIAQAINTVEQAVGFGRCTVAGADAQQQREHGKR